MTNILSELATEAANIAEACGNDASAIDTVELATMAEALKYAAFASGAFLAHRCGDDRERARVHIARALDLPASVLRRRAGEAERIVALDGLPNIPQHAAHVAVLMNNVTAIEAMLEQRRSGSALQ